MKVMIIATSSFSKSFVFKKVSSTLKRKACLKSVFEKLHFQKGFFHAKTQSLFEERFRKASFSKRFLPH